MASATQQRTAARYCDFVEPQHPLVERIFRSAREQRGGRRAVLMEALQALDERCVYVPTPPGRRSFDELARDLEACQGRLEMNCINLSCLLVARLRASGFTGDQVLAAIGIRRDMWLSLTTPHCWVLARTDGAALWIDPARLGSPETLAQGGRELLTRYNVFVVFNDQQAHVAAAEKRQALTGVLS